MSDLSKLDFDSMTAAEFEQYLPELFASGETGRLSEDPAPCEVPCSSNPDCAALVRDLETIAETAKSLLVPDQDEPSDSVWSNIAKKLNQ